MNLNEVITTVRPLDEAAMAAARERQAQLAKPPGSLGRLEELSLQLAGITGKSTTKSKRSTFWYLPLTTAWWQKGCLLRLKV